MQAEGKGIVAPQLHHLIYLRGYSMREYSPKPYVESQPNPPTEKQKKINQINKSYERGIISEKEKDDLIIGLR